MKGSKKNNWKRILLIVVLLAICLYSAVRLAHYVISSIAVKQTNEELQEIWRETEETPVVDTPAEETIPAPTETPEPQLLAEYQYIGDTILPEAQKLLAKNPDTVAWLHIPGGIVDLPVVYRDNSYYMDHNFYGKKSNSGTLFLDEKHPLFSDSQYLVIHGHNWFDGSMFGTLSHYRRDGYMEEHPAVYLSTLYRQEEYEVIGVLYVPIDPQKDGYVPYIGMRKFQSLEQFYGFAAIIQENALHWKEGAEMLPSDAFLALSTCYKEYRIVVMCKRTHPQ